MGGLLVQQLGGFVDDFGALGIARFLPARKAGGRGREFFFKLLVGYFVEGLDEFIVKWIDAFVAHDVVLMQCWREGARWRRPNIVGCHRSTERAREFFPSLAACGARI